MLSGLLKRWGAVLEWWAVLKPARLPILMVGLVLVFLMGSEQGRDVVRALAERQAGAGDDAQRLLFFASVLAWAVYAWYWARVMLRLAFRGVPGNEPRFHAVRTWLPRLLGTAGTLGVAAALALAARGYDPERYGDVRGVLFAYAFWCLLGSIAFFVAVTFRRRLTRGLLGRLPAGPAPMRRAIGLLQVSATEEVQYGAAGLRDLGHATLLVLAATILFAVLLLVLFVFALQASAPIFGTAAILIFAATGWIAGGSALDVIGMRLRLPVFTGLFALAVLFSPLNDNHAVRTLASGEPAARPALRDRLREWLDAQPPALERYPIYLVDAEGGGIRAAFWTASVLGELQGTIPGFEQRLFSLSGVSGGSLGAAVFAALLAERRAGRDVIPKQAGQQVLAEDFLSPVAAAMLYPDLLQRVLPFPVHRFDRAVALEQAWERAWRRHVPGSDRFAEPMAGLRAGAGWAPLLFLNATWVETGKRAIAADAAIAPEDFVDAEDTRAFFAPRALRLSTAVHLSARFTYVSPAGTLVKDGETHGRLVDGGYFENSGATTTLEIALAVQAMALDPTEDPRWERVVPTVIHISNEPRRPDEPPETLAAGADNPRIAPGAWMPEVLSPLRTLFSTREARGTFARETLRLHVGADNFFHFGLCRESANPPLGWVLSSSTRRGMNQQLAGERCMSGERTIFDNRGNLERLRARDG